MNDFKIWLTYWYGVPTMPDNRIEKIKQAGFKYLSLHWCDEYESANGKKEVIIDKCKERGLQIGIFHLPFENANDLWKDDNSGKQLFSIYKTCLSDASNYNVEYVVMHLNSNSKKLQNIEIGITRIKKLLELASKLNVNIAFENLPDDDYLEQIEELLKNYPNACLCFDIGHNNIKYSKFMCSHKEKIQVMHIHDNIGKKDTLHIKSLLLEQ